MPYDPRRGAWLRRSHHHHDNTPSQAQHLAHAFDEETGYRLAFEATASQPDYAKLFLAVGGSINTAAAAGPTDFALTGSTAAVKVQLHSNECSVVTVDLPASMVKEVQGKLQIDSCAKLNITSQRVGAAINGTLVDTHAGAGSVYLSNVLRTRETHTQVPCVYGMLASHASTIGISNMRVLDQAGDEVDIEFVHDETKASLLGRAEGIVTDWAHKAWTVRESIQYKLSPTLTKSVAKVGVGVNDKGYELVHNVIDQEFPFSVQSLNSLFEHAIGMELEYDPKEVQHMLDATSTPGMKAAVWTQTIAAACSTAAAFLVAYRADGRTVMKAAGSGFEATESWLRTPMRTPCEANDCDGSALLVTSMLQAAVDATEDELAEHPYVRSIKNAVFPYYTFGIAVVAANAAEASAGGGEGDHVAGHALALMVPVISFMAGMDRAATAHSVGGKPVHPGDPATLRAARYTAIFTDDVLRTLPEAEASRLRVGNVGDWDKAAQLQPYAIEGTTPASPVMYLPDAERRAQHARESQKDMQAFAQAAPNVGRSMKVLHVGGKHSADPHRFYHDIVEISLHASHPFYTDPAVRDLSAGASQYVFARPTRGSISQAGATPRQLVSGEYFLVPLYQVDKKVGGVLDFAATCSKLDVVPPRPGPMALSVSQSRDIRRSIAALKALDAKLCKDEKPGHCVAYTFAFSSLVNNPQAIEHFCKRIESCAVAGIVDFRVVKDLAVHPGEGGEQGGHFVVANVVMEV